MQFPVFHTARLKLTFSYVLIIFLITALFSGVIDVILTREVRRFSSIQRERLERRLQDNLVLTPDMMHQAVQLVSDMDFEQQIVNRIHLLLIIIDVSILSVSAYVSYILAGKSLQPIHTMVEEQQRFISDASHELKTPLTALRTTLEVALRNPKLTLVEAKQLMQENLAEILGIQNLSEALLKSHSYDHNEDIPQFKAIKFDKLIASVIKTVSPLARQKNISINSSLKASVVQGSDTQLKELLMILLDNAIKYSPEHSQININLTDNRDQAKLQITDQGIGITKSDLPYIFDRFYKTDVSRTRNSFKGYGLGLSIAKRIVELHQGDIYVKSKVGKGSTFTIFLPLN